MLCQHYEQLNVNKKFITRGGLVQEVCLWVYSLVLKTSMRANGMRYEDEFFAEMHPQIAQVIGVAVMQLLVEKQEPSREALIEMIQVL